MARRARVSGVTGGAELIATMRSIGQSVLGSEIDVMAKESLAPMKARTQQLARLRRQPSTKPGQHLDQGVVIAKKESRGRYKREYWLSYKGRAARIAHLVEFGTAPHAQPRRGIMHPGARAFPFARPAYEATKDEAGDIFAKGVWSRIQTAVRRNVK